MDKTHCIPKWALEVNATCPYGFAIPGEVTIPTHLSFSKAVAVFYSILPYVLVALNAFELIVRRGTKQLSCLAFSALIVITNELTIKRMFAQARPGASGLLRDENGWPVGSCLTTCGMPSSHAAMSMGFLVLIICDGVYRVVPSKDELENGLNRSFRMRAEACIRDFFRTFQSSTPLSPRNLMTHSEFVVFFLAWCTLLIPVPIMRVRIYDHSSDQVMAGSMFGFFMGVGWFVFIQFLTRRWKKKIGDTVCFGLFRHDYRPAEFRVKLDSERDIVGSVVLKGAQIVMPSDSDLRGEGIRVSVRGSLQLQEFNGGGSFVKSDPEIPFSASRTVSSSC